MRIKSLIFLLLFFASIANGQSIISTKDSIKSYTYQLINKALLKRSFMKIAIWDFTDRMGVKTDFGKYVADQLSIYATDVDRITVLDRQNLNSIIQEHKLKDKDLLIDKNALLELRKFSGADVVLVGKASIFENSNFFQLTTVIVDVNTSHRLASKEDYIPVDNKFIEVSGFTNKSSGKSSTQTGTLTVTENSTKLNNINNEVVNKITPIVKDKPCVKNNTGDYCFTNLSKYNLKLSVEKTPISGWITDPDVEELIIPIGDTKCVLSYSADEVYRFRAQLNDPNDYKNGQRAGYYWSISSKKKDIVDQGTIRVEQCKSKDQKITSNTVNTGEN